MHRPGTLSPRLPHAVPTGDAPQQIKPNVIIVTSKVLGRIHTTTAFDLNVLGTYVGWCCSVPDSVHYCFHVLVLYSDSATYNITTSFPIIRLVQLYPSACSVLSIA